ncbi:DUF883 family protein [Oceanimonas baumannii]|uniref:ElaB/YqjD/DUF883 family membrane-anchored ribosome-binding protein n=1 Tax=Oceanimonas baumannii TaxID=129578 RepID=A0A235CNC6_9GAMM|nr:DUF883 family protein [Oceanimonas baumannii]OYD26071.1 hypothetical protein B6S09_00330 [Oceanimonas baumannii]TDW62284.1 ElaB/YqjD/DUF883 family membrane-anchored ribosome-binding protein [Oceanimonas baumannii]
MSGRYEAERTALMQDVKQLLKDAEALYQAAADDGTQEGKALKEKLKSQLEKAQQQYYDMEESVIERTRQAASQTNDLVHSKPYHAMGVAAVVGLLLAALLCRGR